MKLFRVVLNVTPQTIDTCGGKSTIEGRHLITVIAENAAEALAKVLAEYDGTDGEALEVDMVVVRQHKQDRLATITVAYQADILAQARHNQPHEPRHRRRGETMATGTVCSLCSQPMCGHEGYITLRCQECEQKYPHCLECNEAPHKV
jgi:hypothetical protein